MARAEACKDVECLGTVGRAPKLATYGRPSQLSNSPYFRGMARCVTKLFPQGTDGARGQAVRLCFLVFGFVICSSPTNMRALNQNILTHAQINKRKSGNLSWTAAFKNKSGD